MKDISEKEYQDKLKRINARIAANKAESLSEVASAQLPAWADVVRGVPNGILRGALFGISNERIALTKRTVIAAVDDYEIRYIGILLNQTILDVWEGLLHIARLHPLGARIEITANSLLKALGRGTGKSQHEQLKEELAILGAGFVEITSKKLNKTFAGNLISSFKRDEETGHLVVTFNSEMKTLYESDYTMIDWGQRMALGRNNLAKWLHGHYASHAKPLPYKVETLRDLCRSDVKELFKFRQLLRVALDKLLEVGAIDGWDIDSNDLVHVVRMPSNSQKRHLVKTQRKPKR